MRTHPIPNRASGLSLAVAILLIHVVAVADDRPVAAKKDAIDPSEVVAPVRVSPRIGEIPPDPTDQPLAVPKPSLILDVPDEVLIGQDFDFTVTLQHDPLLDGYAPYVELWLPFGGTDGNGKSPNTSTGIVQKCDGISYVAANELFTTPAMVPITKTCPPTFTTPSVYRWLGYVDPPTACSTSVADHCIATTCATFAAPPPCFFGTADDPFGPSLAGYQKVVLFLTFGSFVTTQPDVDIRITAHVSDFADTDSPLTIYARAGFEHGDSATGAVSSNETVYSASTTPTVFTVKKDYIGPESETVTGPNFPRIYKLTVDIADTQTVDNLIVGDCLDTNVVAPPDPPPGGPQLTLLDPILTTPPPDNFTAPSCNNIFYCMDLTYFTILGGPQADDVSAGINFSVPEFDCSGFTEVLGADCRAQSINNVRAKGDWKPLDPRDPATIPVTSDITPIDHTLDDKCFALQKSWTMAVDTGHAGPTPGDTILYTLKFQISDFRTLGDLILTDYLSDGQSYAGPATLTVSDKYKPLASSVSFTTGVNLFVTQNIHGDWLCNDGTTTLVNPSRISFDISQLVPGPRPGILTGGLAGLPLSSTPATGEITFRATIDDKFKRRQIPMGHDFYVDKDDQLSDCPVIEATVFTNEPQVGLPPAPTQYSAQDDSFATLQIVSDTLVKSICQINGTNPNAPCNPPSLIPPTVAPGDRITFRIQYGIPSSDAEALVLHDWVPLPVLKTTNLSSPAIPTSPSVPATDASSDPGSLRAYLASTPPTLTKYFDNDFTIDFPPLFNNTANLPRDIDFRFTLEVNTAPFADGLHFTNEVTENETDTFGNPYGQVSVAEFVLGEPKLRIKKGVVRTTKDPLAKYDPNPPWTNAGGFAGFDVLPNLPPFNGKLTSAMLDAQEDSFLSDVSNVDAFDTIRYAIIVENRGTSPNGAFDVKIRDTFDKSCWSATCTGLPTKPCTIDADCAGVGTCNYPSITGLVTNLQVVSGADPTMQLLCNTGACTVQDLFDPTLNGGITLADSTTGALAGYSPTMVNPGANVVIITFDLPLPAGTRPACECVNRVDLRHYAGIEGGPDHVAAKLSTAFKGADGAFTDSAKIRANPTLTKSIVSTSEPTTLGNNLTIGEIVRYRLETVVPEGISPGVIIQDVLPTDMSWLGVPNQCLLTIDSPITTTNPPVLTAGGANNGTLSLNLGTVSNSCPNCTPRRIVIECNAFVLNTGTNVKGGVKSNYFTMKIAPPFPSTCITTFQSNTVSSTIVEPAGLIDKIELPLDPAHPDQTRYRLTYVNSGNSVAFDVHVGDLSETTIVSATVTQGSCGPILGIGTLQIDADCGDVLVGHTVTIEYVATDKQLCETYTNTAQLSYTSLHGVNGWPTPTPENPTGSVTPDDPGNLFDGERLYRSSKHLDVKHCPDLGIEKSHVGNFPAGGYGTYTIIVSNFGNVTSVPLDVVTDPLPPGLIFFSSTGTNWTCSGTNVVTCTHSGPGIPPLTSTVITITVIVPCGQHSVDNCATIETTFDGNPANNTDCDHTDFTTEPECVIAVSAGGNHSLALRSDGTVWAWGSNTFGQLGDGTNVDSDVPLQVAGLTGVVEIAAGFRHSLARTSDGRVWSWGSNANGQLGRVPTSLPGLVQIQFGDLTDVKGIACNNHSVAVKTNGEAWAWGLNADGQLGDGSTTSRNFAAVVRFNSTTPLTSVMAVTTGARNTYALLTDGTVVSSGDNSLGQRGRTGPGALFANAPVILVGTPTSLTGITAIAGASGSAMALKNDGTVWTWGSNVHGELGINSTTNSLGAVPVLGAGGVGTLTGINLIAGGADHQLAVKNDGTVFTWGRADLGQLGNGALFESHVPVQVVDPTGFLGNVKAIAEGSSAHHALVVQNGGRVRSWGSNFKGQLGDDTTTNSSIPVHPVVPCPGCVPPPTHMTAWWPFDEPGGIGARDIRLTPNNGTYEPAGSGPTPTPGKVGYSLLFTGAGDHVSVPPQADLDFGTGDFTIDTWVNTLQTGNTTLVDKRVFTPAGIFGYSLYLSGGQVGLLLADGTSDSYTEVGAPVATGVWTHIAVTVRRKDPNGITFYVDGQPQGPTYDPTPHPMSLDNTDPLLIGARQPVGAQFFEGSLDELEFFKRALSHAEINAIWGAQSAGKCKCVSCEEQWADRTTNTPGARDYHAMAFDAAIAKTVMFGGYDGLNVKGDTWTWNGTIWVPIPITATCSVSNIPCTVNSDCLLGGGICLLQPPPARWRHAMAYDSVRQRVVMFGGRSSGPELKDTWEFNGTSWTRVVTTGPPGREFSAMAYDSARNVVWLFGGSSNFVPQNDTWKFDGLTWTQVFPVPTLPLPRAAHGLVYDSVRDRLVLFGGVGNGSRLGDTWEMNPNTNPPTWTQVANSGPAPRIDLRMVYGPTCGPTLLFGGTTTAGAQGDTWGWDGNTWTLLDTAGPPARYAQGMAFDTIRGKTVLFGGAQQNAGAVLGDTWERSP